MGPSVSSNASNVDIGQPLCLQQHDTTPKPTRRRLPPYLPRPPSSGVVLLPPPPSRPHSLSPIALAVARSHPFRVPSRRPSQLPSSRDRTHETRFHLFCRGARMPLTSPSRRLYIVPLLLLLSSPGAALTPSPPTDTPPSFSTFPPPSRHSSCQANSRSSCNAHKLRSHPTTSHCLL
jgi:hypothetical protein